MDFDRKYGLRSIPVSLGKNGALWASRLTHITAAILFLVAVPEYNLGLIGLFGSVLAVGIIYAQHHIMYRNNGEPTPLAFNLNLLLGLVLATAVIVDVLF
jgi:4-hydroxybenzoate polyprenyltransferase